MKKIANEEALTDNTTEALNKVLGDSALVQLKDDDETTTEDKP